MLSLLRDEPQLAVRSGQAYVPRLEPLPARPAGGARPLAVAGDGTVLVTGGTGALGALVAGHLAARHGVRHLVLLSRRGLATMHARELVKSLAAVGAEATVVAGDAADRETLARVLAGIPAAHPLTGVVHAAGIRDDAVITSLAADQLDRQLRVKLTAAVHLHELTRGLDLAAFILFTSAAGVLGTPGQGGYAAANAALDALAEHRRALGLTATSLAWGPWAEAAGMAGRLSRVDQERLRRAGLVALDRGQALELFDEACATRAPVLVPALLDRSAPAFRQAPPALLRRLASARPGQASGEAEVTSQLAGLRPAERRRHLRRLVNGEIAAVTSQEPGVIDPQQPFGELGLDSLMTIELRNRLTNATGLPLPATLAFDHPTPAELADYLNDQLPADGNGQGPEDEADPIDSIDTADVEALVRMAVNNDSTAGGADGRA
jgi:short-subunit dehydrogenase/acyl carrier protein